MASEVTAEATESPALPELKWQAGSVDVQGTITPLHMFLWLICSECIGVLFVPVFRRYFLSDPNMVFADGVSAAETAQVLDSRDDETRGKLRLLSLTAILSGITSFLDSGLNLLKPLFISQRFQVGIDWSLLSFGTRLLVGPRIALSVGLGAVFMIVAGPAIIARDGIQIVNSGIAETDIAACDALVGQSLSSEQTSFMTERCGMMNDYLRGNDFSILLLWTMWPATALIIASGLTAVALQWRSIVSMFRELSARQAQSSHEDLSLRTTIIGVLILTTILAVVQDLYFDMSYNKPFWLF